MAAVDALPPVVVKVEPERRVWFEWMGLCDMLGVPINLADKWWLYIRDCYGQDGRHYHTLDHICSMLNLFQICKGKLQRCEEVLLAIFFHELV